MQKKRRRGKRWKRKIKEEEVYEGIDRKTVKKNGFHPPTLALSSERGE